ncbi:MAG: asparagine synthase C-terminal domain-containing protein [Rhodocyclaceae bacterium]|nr:asparagine synthase C-terminal domain-containing protein [Rhodocyclaceae bacterium]
MTSVANAAGAAVGAPRGTEAEPTGEREFSLGQPVFADADLSRLQKEEGDLAAWRRAFALRGTEAPRTVSGDFAVAVRVDADRLFLAVDRFAVRSLCYRIEGDTLRCAERADQVAGTHGEIDPQAIYDYFYFHVIPAPRTIFRRVLRLPPGHAAQFEKGRLTLAPYWIPEFEETRPGSFPELKSEFLQLLETSVRNQLDGRRIGCFLSGGTDSSSVAGMLTRVTGRPAACYSIGFDAQGYDEMEYARIAARHFGTEHHEYYITPEDLVRGIPEVASHYDQPFGNSSALPAFFCARMAREDGIEKLLAGDGGDELFCGNTRYAKQRVFDWYWGLPAGLRHKVLEPLSVYIKDIPLLRKGASYVAQARVPMPDRTQTYNLLSRLGLAEVLTPGFLAQVDTEAPLVQQREVWEQARGATLVNRMLAFDWRYTLADNDLPKVCGTANLAGVAVGFPLLDQCILDFSLRLPPDYKLKGLKLRWFFKEALRGFLPDEILAKSKHGFGLPFGVWVTRHAALKRLAEESLHNLADRGLVRHAFIDSLLTEHLSDHPGYYGEMVWIMMMMEQWLRHHAPSYRCAHE